MSKKAMSKAPETVAGQRMKLRTARSSGAKPAVESGRDIGSAATPSIAGKGVNELTMADLTAIGLAAGRGAFQAALAADVPVAVLVGDQIKFMIKPAPKPRASK